MHTNYASFWLSMNSVLRKDGLFLLSEKIERKPLENIVSKKRAEYRRRYEQLNNLIHSVSSRF